MIKQPVKFNRGEVGVASARKAGQARSDQTPARSVDGNRSWHCKMCQYDWKGRRGTMLPKECPNCKSRNWR